MNKKRQQQLEFEAEDKALNEMEEGICEAEYDFEEDSDFAKRTKPGQVTSHEAMEMLDEIEMEVKELQKSNHSNHTSQCNVFALNTESKKITITTKRLQHCKKYTYKSKLQIGKKKYALRQELYDYGTGNELELHTYWYLTNATMKAIIKNHARNIQVKLKSYFDGMIDGTSFVENPEFGEPSTKYYEKLLRELSSRGLFSCHYREDTGIFELYSCCDSLELAIFDVPESLVGMKFL